MSMAYDFGEFNTVSHEVLMANTRSHIKKRYRDAHFRLRDRVVNISRKEARAKCFVKYEKIPISKFEQGKSPRLIQFREFEYIYDLKRRILGHSLRVKSEPVLWNEQPVNSIFTKVHDNYGIARVLEESWNMFADPIAICLDHSKFDGHYCAELLKIEHKYWTSLNRDPKLPHLLEMQLINKGVTANGHFVKGTARLSGETTTSEGNSVLNYAMIVRWLKASGITKFRIHVNGDDSVVMIEASDRSKLLDLSFFRNFNMETECEIEAMDFRLISYCQASPIRVKRGGVLVWYMVKNPSRTLSRIQYCDKRFLSVYKRFLVGVGLCELAVNTGLPVMQEFSKMLISIDAKPLGCVDKVPAQVSGNQIRVSEVLDITRSDFEYAFGMPRAAQQHLESLFAGEVQTSPKEFDDKLNRYKQFLFN